MKKILIADDDSVTRGMLTRVLKPCVDKFEVFTASNEYQTLNLLSRKQFDLLVTDLQITDRDEYEFLNLISKEHPDLPVFVITAFGTQEIKNRVEKIGKCRYFEKPLNIDILTESIVKEIETRSKILKKKTNNRDKKYSEHYSLTKNFIAKIDEVQKPANKISRKEDESALFKNNSLKKQKPAVVVPLSKLFQKIPGIINYGIYDKHDFLHAKFSKSGQFDEIKPSVYHGIILSLQTTINNGYFQHLVIKNKGITYVLFHYKDTWTFIAVNPGFKINHFIKTLKKNVKQDIIL